MYSLNKRRPVDRKVFVRRTENSELLFKLRFALHAFHEPPKCYQNFMIMHTFIFKIHNSKGLQNFAHILTFSPLLRTQTIGCPPLYLIHLPSSLPLPEGQAGTAWGA
jgi:hypothetical protein